nr:hypothetical protein [Tanacetum cinerariifolium]
DVENVFNQGRISVDMDQDEGIELVVDQEKNHEIEVRQAEIYNIDLDHSSNVLSMQEDDTEYIKRYHGFKKKPQSKFEVRKNMISYLKNTEGYKMEF